MRAVSLAEAALKTAFGFSVGKNIILPFVKLNLLSFFLLYPVRENEISHDENWGVRGVREWVEV